MKNLLLTLFIIISPLSYSNDFVSSWYGKVNFGTINLRVVFNIDTNGSNYIGTMESPDQSSGKIPIEQIIVTDSTIVLSIPKLMIHYQGKLNKEGNIDGIFSQNNTDFLLILSKEDNSKAISRPQEPQKPYPYKVKEVTIRNSKDNIDLSGTLTLPNLDKKDKVPAVILVTGSGPQNRDEEILNHKPFLVIADYLTRNGIAVLRYDDRGVGKSEGNFGVSTTLDFVKDAEAAFYFLRQQNNIDSSHVGIIGHSEGGAIAAILGSQNKDVSFIISLAGMGVKSDAILLKQAEDSYKSMNVDETIWKKEIEQNKQIFNIINSESDKEIIKTKIYDLLSANNDDQKVKQIVAQVTSDWFISFIKLDIQDYLAKISIPVLALNGDKDIQVNADINITAIKNTIESNGNENVTTKIYPQLNHLFQKCNKCTIDEYGELEETFNPEVLQDITNWILSLD